MVTLIRPLINEKSTGLAKLSFYSFEVAKDTTKKDVKRTIEDKFKVHVQSVKVVNLRGKRKSQPTRKGYFKTPAVKKAIVQLKKGQKIALFELAQAEDEEVTVRTAEGQPVVKVKERKSLLGQTKVKVEKLAEETGGEK